MDWVVSRAWGWEEERTEDQFHWTKQKEANQRWVNCWFSHWSAFSLDSHSEAGAGLEGVCIQFWGCEFVLQLEGIGRESEDTQDEENSRVTYMLSV